MDAVTKRANKIKIGTIIENLEKRNMKGYYCQDAGEAKELALSLIGEDDVVAWGGSVTVDQIGIRSELKNVIDRDAAPPEDFIKVRRDALLSDVFLTSTNAITMDGELVNIDGMGNRVAAMCFGPGKVIVIAGANKIVRDEEAAIARIKTDACPPNCVRLLKKTPCAATGKCGDCKIPGQTICSYTVTTRFSAIPDRIHVILVNEKLGF
jgi:hypothetical protein